MAEIKRITNNYQNGLFNGGGMKFFDVLTLALLFTWKNRSSWVRNWVQTIRKHFEMQEQKSITAKKKIKNCIR